MSQPTSIRGLTSLVLGLFLTVLAIAPVSAQGVPIVIDFDDAGPEIGVTPPGTQEFGFQGTRWSGGTVKTLPSMYLASGDAGWVVAPGGTSVEFETPLLEANFFFVHELGKPIGTARFFDDQGALLGTVTSNEATVFGAQANIARFASTRPIHHIHIVHGIVDAALLKPDGPPPAFVRGDCNADGFFDLADAVSILVGLFVTPILRDCNDACDSNDDGRINISDAVATLGSLFGGSGPLPGGGVCAIDGTTWDGLDCRQTLCP